MENQSRLKSLQEALKYSPDNVPLLKLYGDVCLDEWSLAEGKEAFEHVLKLHPEDIDAKLGVAKILYQMGKTSEALVRTESVIHIDPQCAQALVLLSKINISEGQLKSAFSFYEKARQIDATITDGAIEKELGLRTETKDDKKGEPDPKVLNTDLGWVEDALTPGADETDEEDYEEPLLIDNVEKSKTNFSHVGGMEKIKEEIRMKIIHPLKNKELFKAYGKKMGGGVLLYGPPGCGKTLVSRATAGEINAHFLCVGLHNILDMYIGNSEKNLHDIFELARNNAPSVLFFDEIDALAANRTDLKQSASRTVINQLLAEMDGSLNANEGVLILGATNAPWHIDPAFRRPGRFDRIVFVPTPDEAARLEIFKIAAKDKPCDKLDFRLLAKKTPGYSGADIEALFDTAVEDSLSKAMKENRIIPITTKDLLKAIKGVSPSSKTWFESAKNYALFANQSGIYDPILDYFNGKP